MQLMEISNKVNSLGKSWEEFKSVNEEKLQEISKKGKYDPLFDEQLNRINQDITNQKSRLDLMEISLKRGSLLDSELRESADENYKNAFKDYLTKGNENGLNNLQAKSLSSISDPEGGYLIRPKQAANIVKIIEDVSIFRNLASVETISTDSLDILEDVDKLTSGWTAETAPRSETNTPKLSKKRIQVHEMYAQPHATQKLIDDSVIDIEKWLTEKLATSFAEIENDSFINGDGASKPRGILSYQDGKSFGNIEQIKTENVDADSIIKLYFALKEQYLAKSSFLMNRYSLEKIRLLKNKESDQYIWTPGLGIGVPDTLLGSPVYTSSSFPAAEKAKFIMAFANFKLAYKIVDRAGIRVLRDPFTNKPFVKFYATKRVGGDVVNSDAIKLMITE